MPRAKPTAVKYVKAAKGAAKGAKRPPKSYKAFSAHHYGVANYARVQQPPLNDQAVCLTALSVRVEIPVLPDLAWGGQVFTALSYFPRALAMSKLFQEYRITRMDYLLQPNATVYGATNSYAITGGVATAQTSSACYLQGLKWLNAPKVASDVTDTFMSEVGVTPVIFDKECVITQKPIVNYNIAGSTSATAAPTTGLAVKQSPWIACIAADLSANNTSHWGPIVRIVQQPVNTSDGATPPEAVSPGWYQVRCTFEFRKPGFFKAPPT
uniref:hypothetical protein n=1 Tax=Polynucleobacter sp. TaxID=2029855 RepID=UPI004048AE57